MALVMLRQLLNPARYDVEIIAAGTLASEIAAAVAKKKPPLVCIATVAREEWLSSVTCASGCARFLPILKSSPATGATRGEIDTIRESLIAAGADTGRRQFTPDARPDHQLASVDCSGARRRAHGAKHGDACVPRALGIARVVAPVGCAMRSAPRLRRRSY